MVSLIHIGNNFNFSKPLVGQICPGCQQPGPCLQGLILGRACCSVGLWHLLCSCCTVLQGGAEPQCTNKNSRSCLFWWGSRIFSVRSRFLSVRYMQGGAGGSLSWGPSQSPSPSITSTKPGGTVVGSVMPCHGKSFGSPEGMGSWCGRRECRAGWAAGGREGTASL